MNNNKWNNPTEWLLEWMKELDREGLYNVIDILTGYVDPDHIQESFHDDMDNNGYFE